MRKLVAVLGALVSASLVLIAPAGAVKFGQPDGGGHPYVGLVVFYEDGAPLWRCTGSLLSPTKLLTAGHCTGVDVASGTTPDRAEIWFDPGYPTPIPLSPDFPAAGPDPCAGVLGYPCTGDVGGTPVPDPLWNGGLTRSPQTHDVGVVLLDGAVGVSRYALLPPLGYLDGLASKRGQQDVRFTVVGYGLQAMKPVQVGLRTRVVGAVSLVSLRSALTDGWNIRTSNNPGQGQGGSGGTCFGDSGGPVLQGDVVVGVDSFVSNKNCAGASYAYRVDTASAQAFVNGTN